MTDALRRTRLDAIRQLVSEAIVIADDSGERLVAAHLHEALELTEQKLAAPGADS